MLSYIAAAKNGVTAKRSKSKVAVTEVDFDGFRLSETGIQCSPDFLISIRDFLWLQEHEQAFEEAKRRFSFTSN